MSIDPSSFSQPCEIFSDHHHHPETRRVLVVDDYVDSADALSMFLDAHGFEARVTYRGIAAIEVARAWAPAVIFLDISMPDMSGLVVALQLKSFNETAGIVLIAYTANSAGSEIARMKDAGFDAYCAKPANPANLLALAEYYTSAMLPPHELA